MRRVAKLTSGFSRGALARSVGVNSETIRYYESISLMPEPGRTTGGHRLYGQTHRKRLCFIKRCRELGFRLEEIKALLVLVDGGDYTCAEIRGRTAAHLADIEEKLRDLRRMQRTLKAMIARCDEGSIPDCPIVDALFSD